VAAVTEVMLACAQGHGALAPPAGAAELPEPGEPDVAPDGPGAEEEPEAGVVPLGELELLLGMALGLSYVCKHVFGVGL